MVARPRSSASCCVSSSMTGMPAFAKLIAMPPPMVPAPTMAAWRMGRVGVSDGTSGTLLASRSAKNAWRSAFDAVVCIRCMKRWRSNLTPSSNGIATDAATVSTHSSGAGNCCARACASARARASSPSASGCATCSARTVGSGRRSATVRAKAAAASTRSVPAGKMASKSCVSASCSDSTGVPVTIICSARSSPTARGRRWVPPAPGSKPSLTSGRAIWAPGSATR